MIESNRESHWQPNDRPAESKAWSEEFTSESSPQESQIKIFLKSS